MQPITFHVHISPMRLLLSALLSVFLAGQQGRAQCTLACSQGLQISLDQQGQATVTAGIIAPYAAANCPNDLELTVFNAQNQAISPTLHCGQIGQTLSVRVRHIPSGNVCFGSVTPKDYLPPTLQCPEEIIACNADTSAQSIGFALVNDNCAVLGDADLVWENDFSDLPCHTMHNGTEVTAKIERTWATEDDYGNSASCVQTIFIKRNTKEEVEFPVNRDGFDAPFLVCGQNPNDLSLTGFPTIAGNAIPLNSACELTIGHSDQSTTTCGGAKRIFRTWVASDYCTQTFRQHIQIIEIRDTTPPTLVAPANITVGSDASACGATITLPQGTASDACSGVTQSAAWAFGTGFGPFTNVPLGTHIATLRATDACGNSTQKTMSITIVDNISPSALCKNSIIVSLPSTGTSDLPVSAINQGSFDNCSGLSMEISRDNVHFSDNITIDCQDVSQAFQAHLRVRDAAGLENTCATWVTVRETLKPYISCPSNVTLTCLDDPDDLALTSTALASDNCHLDTLFRFDSVFTDACAIGNIRRTWKAVDAAGNFQTCQQQITLQAVQTIAVQFPSDITINACSSPNALVPTQTGQPTHTGQSCSTLSKDYTDQILTNVPQGCYVIERHWRVRDLCTYDPNFNTGLWTHTQRITVHDQSAPVLQMPNDVTVSATNCIASVALPSASASDCGSVVFSHNSAYAAQQGANASGSYPIGQHTVWFLAADACGNQSQSSLQITVVDSQAPTVQCATNVALNLGNSGILVLSPSHFVQTASDNCTDLANLQFTFTKDTMTCADLGQTTLSAQVQDQAGNTASCQTTVTLSDPSESCSAGVAFYEMEGTIENTLGHPIPQIPVRLVSDGYSDEVPCGVFGDFSFEDVPSGAAYRIEPYNDIKPALGVNTYDMLLVTKHLLGFQPIEDPYVLLAADANQSGSITPSDITYLRKLVLGIEQQFPGGQSWQFLPKDYAFSNPENPFLDDVPDNYTVFADTNKDSLDFYGLKIGDIDLSADPSQARTPKDTIFLEIQDQTLTRFWPSKIEVNLPDWAVLEGFQFSLKSKPEQVELSDVEFMENGSFQAQHLNKGILQNTALRAAWDVFSSAQQVEDSLLFRLTVFPKASGLLSEILMLDNSEMKAEAYATEGEPLRHIALRFLPEKNVRPLGKPLEISPNPFTDQCTVRFLMPLETEATVRLSNAQGQIVLERHQPCSKGINTLRLHAEDFQEHGIYFLHIESVDSPPLVGKIVFGVGR